MIPEIETLLEPMVGSHRAAVYTRALTVLKKHGEDNSLNELTGMMQGDDHVPISMLTDAVDNVILTGFRVVHSAHGIVAEGNVAQMTDLTDGLYSLQHFDLAEPILGICNNEELVAKDKLCELLQLMTTIHYTEFEDLIHYVPDTLIDKISEIYTPKNTETPHVPHARENLNMIKAFGVKYTDCLIHHILTTDQFRLGTPYDLLCKEYAPFFQEDAISTEEKTRGVVSIALVSGARKINIKGIVQDVIDHFFGDPLSIPGLTSGINRLIEELGDA